MTRIALVGLTFALICGCVTRTGGGDDDGNGSSSGSGSNSGSGSGSGSDSGSGVSPRSGGWTYDEITPVSSTCRTGIARGESGAFAIDQVAGASFRITPGDGTAPFTCTTSAAQFTCPNRVSFVIDNRPGLDAVLTIHATVTGTFSDREHGTGTQQAAVDCAGSQCALLGPLPCNFRVSFAIHTR